MYRISDTHILETQFKRQEYDQWLSYALNLWMEQIEDFGPSRRIGMYVSCVKL